jgi:hypothetical protein
MVTHGIKGSIPKEQYDRFLLVFHGEKQLEAAAGFSRPEDAYVLVIDGAGGVRWSLHGQVDDEAVSDAAVELAR